MNRALPYVLFLAMSRNQEKHFQALKNEMPVDGAVINAKHPGLGQTWRALRWVWQHRGRFRTGCVFGLIKGVSIMALTAVGSVSVWPCVLSI